MARNHHSQPQLFRFPVDFENLVLIGKFNNHLANSVLTMHNHKNNIEIIYIDSGFQNYIVDGQEYFLKGGDVLLVLPNQLHGSGQYIQGKGKVYWFQLRVDNKKFLGLNEVNSKQLVREILALKLKQFSVSKEFKIALEKIITFFQKPNGVVSKLQVLQLAFQIVLEVVENANKNASKTVDLKINKAIELIHQRISEKISMLQLAQSVGLSVSTFKIKFKKYIGVPPADFIIREKINKSKELLLQGKKNISEIAMLLHFSSSQHFATAFKRHTGATPLTYKKLKHI